MTGIVYKNLLIQPYYKAKQNLKFTLVNYNARNRVC